MNTERLIEILKESRADAWEITDAQTEGWEFYFIGHRLDQNRMRKVEHVKVTVYVKTEDGTSYGIASTEIAPTWNDHEICSEIDKLCTNATYAKNPVYALNTPKEVHVEEVHITPYENAKKMMEAVRSVNETEEAYINSYEIFTELTTERFLNSEGIDITQVRPAGMLEIVINAKNEEHEIELYRMYRCGSTDAAYLKREIEETMRCGIDRLKAVDTPAGLEVPVVLSTDAACAVYRYFAARLDTAMVYRGVSSMKKGEWIMPEDSTCPVTLKAVKNMPNSSANSVIDAEGAVIEDRVLIDHGKVMSLCGARRYGQYLKEEDTFALTNFAVEPSGIPEAEIRSGTYLEVTEFSGFEVSEMTGDIFGEIRLGYLHDENGVTVVKGGSVSGNIENQLKDMLFSDTEKQYNNISIPALTCLKHLSIAGCAKN